MDDAARRGVNPDFGQPGDEVSFADGYPQLRFQPPRSMRSMHA